MRDGQIKSSKVDIPSLFNATAAIMHVATWNGNENGSSFYNKVNDWTAPAYGKDHFYSYDEIAVPISALNTGENTITFQSSTIHHGIEIMWPGPGITVRYVSGCQPSDTTIDIWYGPNQIFAEVGIPQRWINILGRVTDGDGDVTLTYSLNGSPELPLTVGPDDRRLQDPGDFNVEISYIDPELLLGTNEVVITATDPCGNQTVETVYFEFGDGTIWPLPYTVDWTDFLNLQDVAQVQAVQVVDGLWVLDSGADVGIRSVNTGYDRLVAVGDMDWDDYEVTVPITIHGIDATTGPVSGPPGVGVLMRWDGHYDWDGSQPTWGYYPMGALAWYRYLTDSLGARLRMIGGDNGRFLAEDTSGFKLSFGVRYIFKVRVETIPGQGGRYSLKVWEDGEPEPSDWNLVAQGTLSDPQNGSFLLLAHHADVTFGNISVTPLLIRDISITTGDTWATINWTTTEPATSSVAYGPTQAYENGSVDDFSLVTDHSITLTNLNLGDLYHCQITSVAAGGFSASSEDLTFRTKLPSNIVSDNFNAPSLDVGLWEIVNPVGDGSVEMTGTQVALSVPAGVDHDLWTAGNRSLRIMQPVNDTDFEFDVKFDSSLGARYQIQGVLAEESDGTYVRFDFFSDGSATRIFAASFVNDVPTVRGNTVITAGAPLYIRMKRVGDQWTQFYSSNGTNWNNGASFTFPLSVSKVGVFAGNAGTNPPAYTALVDYFLNTASPPVAPTITTQPADQTVAMGATATFVVAADGTAPLSYQWRKDGVDITGATSASYTTPPTVLADDGALFDCVVDNPANSPATSRQALLTVTSAPVAPSITTQPADQTVVEGQTATFMVAADGTAPLSYQWRKDGVDIAGATSASYTTPPTVLADDGALFDCVVDNPANSPAASRQALLTVTSAPVAPSITTQPADQTVVVGATATFMVAADGTAPLSYQWRKDGVDITGATSASYTTPPTVLADDGALFDCVVDNPANSPATSRQALLTVTSAPVAPSITTQPADQTVVEGATATFMMAADGTAPLSYQWRKDGVDITGATSASYTTPPTVLADDGALFDCVVDNPANSPATSRQALLTVTDVPPSNIVSDNFNAPSLDVGLWEIVNPVGDGSVDMTGAQVALSVPAGTDHDLWTAGNRSLRIMQPVNDADFEFDVKFDSSLGARYQIQGVLAEESDGTYVRFDFFSDGSATRIFAASFVNDVPTVRGNTVVTAGAPSYIRMKRVGDQWTQFYSSNGTNWNNGASFTFPLSVSKVGVFAGNAGTNPPAYTALIDYFLNTASPPVAPTITTQPADQTVNVGQTATFVVVADGTAPLSYQWRKDGVDIAGATSASYTTPPTVLADDGALFDCVVDNPANSPATSQQALLTVTSAPVAPSITTQPADQTVVEGATATFMVAADGTAPLRLSVAQGRGGYCRRHQRELHHAAHGFGR